MVARGTQADAGEAGAYRELHSSKLIVPEINRGLGHSGKGVSGKMIANWCLGEHT